MTQILINRLAGPSRDFSLQLMSGAQQPRQRNQYLLLVHLSPAGGRLLTRRQRPYMPRRQRRDGAQVEVSAPETMCCINV